MKISDQSSNKKQYLSINNIFDDIVEKKRYHYYSKFNYTQYNNFNDIVNNAKTFHQAYFELGNKDILLGPEMQEERYQHVLFVYFLGIYIYEGIPIIKKKIDNTINAKDTNNTIDFKYVWFLLSLYHDMFFDLDCEKNKKMSTEEKRLREFINDNQIKIDSTLLSEKACVPTQIIGKIKEYNEFKCKFNKRKEGEVFYDHGIAGGFAFFIQMTKLFKKPKHELIFSEANKNNVVPKIAGALMGHNIFLRTSNMDKNETIKYKDCNLKCLITDEPIIKFEEHPFLFLLTLVDTIDPFKICNMNVKEALSKKINIDNIKRTLDISDLGIKEKDLWWLIKTGEDNPIKIDFKL